MDDEVGIGSLHLTYTYRRVLTLLAHYTSLIVLGTTLVAHITKKKHLSYGSILQQH